MDNEISNLLKKTLIVEINLIVTLFLEVFFENGIYFTILSIIIWGYLFFKLEKYIWLYFLRQAFQSEPDGRLASIIIIVSTGIMIGLVALTMMGNKFTIIPIICMYLRCLIKAVMYYEIYVMPIEEVIMLIIAGILTLFIGWGWLVFYI